MTTSSNRPLEDRIALVAGATRGAGRGIARMLGEAGATVYCTGRSTRTTPTAGRPETIEETADLVTAAGGTGIAIRVDHSDPTQVEALFARVRRQAGRLDVLVNDIWGGDALSEWRQPLWKLDLAKGFAMLDGAVRTHIVTSRYALPLMVERKRGLVVEITDGDHAGYRGTLFYDLAKMGTIRLAFAMAAELSPLGITALAVTPGFLRSEAMLDGFGVTETNWRDAIPKARGFEMSETPCYVGRAIAALAADPNVATKAGQVFASWTLAREYGFTDIDGRTPHWGDYVETSVRAILDGGGPKDADERFWVDAWYSQLKGEPKWKGLMERIDAARRNR
jgi:NAD(P)-dependent dehydrogenase (short-subunit alcohol dehydrogenase family)